ncbi:hypothetical protein AG1IA_05270 [Rhizoctonia solani AG-1 IA]|uniref:Uncharacterized protein n=1 Tax=Thanatephorus cucumeris (strain AG1-IA) TaxID=983506 RepID=L8WV77_THACA|nr:hypothetical protein AG1IA_05270 [Rhizoctonia solani AG-1 IA]
MYCMVTWTRHPNERCMLVRHTLFKHEIEHGSRPSLELV